MREYSKTLQGKFFNYFNQKLDLKKSTNGFFRTDCPSCGGSHTFGFNPKEGKAHCFKCEQRWSAVRLMMMMEKFETLNEAWKYLDIQKEYDRWEKLSTTKKTEYKQIELPQHYNLISMGDSHIGQAARDYMMGRKFKINSLALRGIGYCDAGPYLGYIVFPIYAKGRLVYWQTRKFIDIGPKMKNPPESEFGIGKETIIYNMDALFIYHTVLAAESITNSLTWGDNSIAGLGKSFSPYQIDKIVTSPCKNIILGLDPDAQDKSINLAMQMCQYKNIKLIVPPNGEDINSMGKHEAKKLARQTPWGTYMDFLKMKNALNEKRGQYTYQRKSSGIMPARGF